MTTAAYVLRPWTEVVTPHADVQSGDLAMGTFAANLAAVAYRVGDQPDVYANPTTFFAATYLTDQMRGVLVDVNRVLCGEPGDRALQLRTPFGGGKTHTLISLYHLASARDRAVAGAAGQLDDLPDPGTVRVAVLSGEHLDPARPRAVDGLEISTLWGELAYQLGGREAYERQLVDGQEGPPPSGKDLVPLLAQAPSLILLDELLVYLVKGKGVVLGDTTAGQLGLIFIQNLSEAVNQVERTAMVYSLQASVGEAAGDEAMLDALEKITARVDARREPVTGDDVLHVVQRRLFKEPGDADVARAVASAYAGQLRDELTAHAETDDERREAADTADRLEQRIVDAFPFHPALIDLMYERWGSLPSYQRTRGALQFLATVVHALWQDGAGAQALISPGDVSLADEHVRSSFFEQVGEANAYSAVVQSDFLGPNAGTRIVDERIGRGSPALRALEVGTRIATTIALLSFGAREGEDRGALEREVVEAALVPDLDGNLIRAGLQDLRRETLLYLHYTGRRYRFETTPNLNLIINGEEQKLTSEEVLAAVRGRLERAIGDAGGQQVAVWPADATKIPDGAPVFVTAYLPPGQDTRHGELATLVTAGPSTNRKHKNGLALLLPAGPAADASRSAARTVTAIEALVGRASQHQFSAEQKAELKERLAEATKTLDTNVGQLYERILLPVGVDGAEGVRFDEVGLGTVLGAGRTLAERVRDALEHHVFDTLKAKRIVSLTQLAEVGSLRCDQLVESFFSYYEFTKLWSIGPIKAAVAEGVRNGDLGYAVRVSEEPDGELRVANPSLVHFEVEIAADEVDLGPDSRVLAPEVARRLGPREPGPVGPGPGPIVDPPPPGPGPQPPPDGRRAVRLSIHATEDDLHTVNTALVNLRNLLDGGSMRLEMSVQAKMGEGMIDEVRFRNGVREVLEEDPDVTFEEG